MPFPLLDNTLSLEGIRERPALVWRQFASPPGPFSYGLPFGRTLLAPEAFETTFGEPL